MVWDFENHVVTSFFVHVLSHWRKIIIVSGSQCKNTEVKSLPDYSLGIGHFEKINPWYKQNTDFCLQGDGRKKDKYFMAPKVSFSHWKT